VHKSIFTSKKRSSEENSPQDRSTPLHLVPDRNWSTSIQSVLDHPPAAFPYQVIWGGVLFGMAFGAWAYLGHVDEVGQARGHLVAGGDVFQVHSVELGKVTNLLVKEGQQVTKGQVIAELDGQIDQGEVTRLVQVLAGDRQQLKQMQGLLDRLNSVAVNQVDITTADTQAQAAAIAESGAKGAALRATLQEQQGDAAAYEERLKRLEPLVAEGVIAQERLFEAEQAWRDRLSAVTRTQGELAQVTAEGDRLRSQLSLKQSQGSNTLLESAQQANQLQVEMTQLSAKITETESLISTAQVKRNQRVLVASVDGIVSTLNVRNPGEVVQPGQTVAEISAQNAPLMLKATIPNQEAGFIRVGLPVQVKFDAYPYQEYGIVAGKVAEISADAKPVNTQAGTPGEPIYQVYIELERNQISANQQVIPFKSGQAASADIVIRRRRIIDLLLDPFRKMQRGSISL
jgi:HlyD family secretion protein